MPMMVNAAKTIDALPVSSPSSPSMRFVALLVPVTMNQMSAMTITHGNAGPKSRTRDSL
jgi:hypothetical protein